MVCVVPARPHGETGLMRASYKSSSKSRGRLPLVLRFTLESNRRLRSSSQVLGAGASASALQYAGTVSAAK